jgi:hypothetical protein
VADIRIIDQGGDFGGVWYWAVVAELADFEVMERIRQRIGSIVTDPAKAAALKPYYRYNCKRPGFHDAYLATFNRPTVHLVDVADTGIERLVANGLVAGGKTYAVTANFMHILEENADHLAYIVRAVTEAGARGFAVSQRAEDDWVATILEKARYDEEFQRSCTPGRFNNEGKPDQRLRLNAAYGGGPMAFFGLLEQWRQAGSLPGLDLIG